MPHPLVRLHRSVLSLWERARRERSTPRELAWSVGVGAFVACTPLLGLHLWLALGLATLFRLNRLWTVIASRLSSTPVLLVTTFCAIESAHRLRTGRWVPLALNQAFDHGKELLLDWVVGTLLVGGLLGLCTGLVTYAFARMHREVKARTCAGVPPPSSESPRSEPPHPTE